MQVVKGIVEGCRQSDCILLGGEVSTLIAFYSSCLSAASPLLGPQFA